MTLCTLTLINIMCKQWPRLDLVHGMSCGRPQKQLLDLFVNGHFQGHGRRSATGSGGSKGGRTLFLVQIISFSCSFQQINRLAHARPEFSSPSPALEILNSALIGRIYIDRF